MSLAQHCDHGGCNTWARMGSDAVKQFVTVTFGDQAWHFCTLDCLMHWAAAHSIPTEEVP